MDAGGARPPEPRRGVSSAFFINFPFYLGVVLCLTAFFARTALHQVPEVRGDRALTSQQDAKGKVGLPMPNAMHAPRRALGTPDLSLGIYPLSADCWTSVH